MTKIKNSKCDKAKKNLKFDNTIHVREKKNLKTKIVIKKKNVSCYKTQKLSDNKTQKLKL